MAINKLPDILDEKEKEYLGIVANGYNNYRKARGWTQLSPVDLMDYENYKFTLISKIEQKYHTLHNEQNDAAPLKLEPLQRIRA